MDELNSLETEIAHFEGNDGKNKVFYELTRTGNDVIIRSGIIGSKGAIQRKYFKTAEESIGFIDRTVQSKISKGFKRKNPVAAAVVMAEESEEGTAEGIAENRYLQSLSVNERDQLLSSIPYVATPMAHQIPHRISRLPKDIVNYSQYYPQMPARLKSSIPFPEPSSLRNGDIIHIGGQDPVTLCVVWLRKGLLHHSKEDIAQLTDSLLESSDEWEEDDSESSYLPAVDLLSYGLSDEQWQWLAGQIDGSSGLELTAEFRAQFGSLVGNERLLSDLSGNSSYSLINAIKIAFNPRVRGMEMPTLVPRTSPGPHNDSRHDCYLFQAPQDDESGCKLPTVVSCASIGYFDNPESSVVLIDPLLAHSQSYYGKVLLSEASKSELHGEDSFPWGCYVMCVDNLNDDGSPGYVGEVEWMIIEDDCKDIRSLLSRHFDPSCTSVPVSAPVPHKNM